MFDLWAWLCIKLRHICFNSVKTWPAQLGYLINHHGYCFILSPSMVSFSQDEFAPGSPGSSSHTCQVSSHAEVRFYCLHVHPKCLDLLLCSGLAGMLFVHKK